MNQTAIGSDPMQAASRHGALSVTEEQKRQLYEMALSIRRRAQARLEQDGDEFLERP